MGSEDFYFVTPMYLYYTPKRLPLVFWLFVLGGSSGPLLSLTLHLPSGAPNRIPNLVEAQIMVFARVESQSHAGSRRTEYKPARQQSVGARAAQS
jgi:hypothetical protein